MTIINNLINYNNHYCLKIYNNFSLLLFKNNYYQNFNYKIIYTILNYLTIPIYNYLNIQKKSNHYLFCCLLTYINNFRRTYYVS